MKRRPIRARIYQPVTRFGVVASDWKFILIIALVCYAVPMLAGWRVGRLPLFLLTGPGALLVSYAFCFWMRIGRRPRWLPHAARACLTHPLERAVLPAERAAWRFVWLLPKAAKR